MPLQTGLTTSNSPNGTQRIHRGCSLAVRPDAEVPSILGSDGRKMHLAPVDAAHRPMTNHPQDQYLADDDGIKRRPSLRAARQGLVRREARSRATAGAAPNKERATADAYRRW